MTHAGRSGLGSLARGSVECPLSKLGMRRPSWPTSKEHASYGADRRQEYCGVNQPPPGTKERAYPCVHVDGLGFQVMSFELLVAFVVGEHEAEDRF